jgi:hypothetical protein
MRDLQKHHIVDVYVWVDDTLQELTLPARTGRPLRFADSTMLPVCKYVRYERHRVAKLNPVDALRYE